MGRSDSVLDAGLPEHWGAPAATLTTGASGAWRDGGERHWRPACVRGCASRVLRSAAAGRRSELRARAGEQWPFLDKYCAECHDYVELAADLALEAMSPDAIADHAESLGKGRAEAARPDDAAARRSSSPTNGEIDRFVAWLEANLDHGASEPYAGHVPLHRLNRTEYANAIQDLLALDVDPQTLLPVEVPKTASTTSPTRSTFRRRSSSNT